MLAWMRGLAKIFLIIAFISLLGAGGLTWQYILSKKVPTSCGGDWSHEARCPFGTFCKSLGQGPMAGGLCRPFLFPAIDIHKAPPNAPIKPGGKEQELTSYGGHDTYGLAGYTSGYITNSNHEYRVQVVPKNLTKGRSAFPCENNEVTVYGGTFVLELGDAPKYKYRTDDGRYTPKNILYDSLDLGERIISYDVNDQDGTFAKLAPIREELPRIEGVGLAERLSCHDTKFTLYGVAPETNELLVYEFVDGNGNTQNYIIIPKDEKIPQRDAEGNFIEDKYDEVSGKRTKIRFGYNQTENKLVEIERWLQ